MKAALLALTLLAPLAAKDKPSVPPEILQAKSVAVIAKLGPVGNGAYTPDLQRAKQQVKEALQKWGRFSVVSDPQKADLVLQVTEGHYGTVSIGDPSKGAVQNLAVLGDILEVYKGQPSADNPPLWTRVETGGYSWPAKRAVSKFIKDVDHHR